jgi:5-formaminoimidazole-4-carboxamide-1-beta-D-ribofuranosyl 5'-monophosphate synthetase
LIGKRPGINITVFNKDKRSSTGTTFKELNRTKTHLEIVFVDTRFEQDITALIRIPKESNIENYVREWV